MCERTYSLPQQSDLVGFALIILTISIVGVVSNVLSAIVLKRHYVFKNQFGRLTMVHAIANVGVLLLFGTWAAPLIVTDLTKSKNLEVMNRYLGQILIFFQEIALHACFFVSLNRFVCICSPTLYRRYFTDKLTYFIIFFIFALCGLYFSAYFLEDCAIYFDRNQLSWTFSDTACGNFLSFYIDFIYNVSLFGVIAILDISSLLLIRINKANVKESLNKEMTRRRRQRDIRFFVQTVATSLVFGATLFSFDVLRCRQQSAAGVFFTGTVAWAAAHMISGLILVGFNREIRRVLRSPTKILQTSITPVVTIRESTVVNGSLSYVQ